MNKKFINTLILSFETIIILISVAILYQINSYNKELYKFSNERLEMIQTADRLRQSSDDLTHFARSYAVTADKKFYKQYFDTLDIRNGEITRPKLYNAIYWDLEKDIREKKHPSSGKKISLDEIIDSLPFTKNELKQLKLSEENSNKLVELEVEAFKAMEGKFKDKKGKYTKEAKINQKYAIDILHSKEYYKTKHLIMNPIDDFIIMLNERTKTQIDNIQTKNQVFYYIFLTCIIIFILGNIFIYRFLNLQDKLENENLKLQISNAIKKTKRQEKLLLKQEKIVALGEMMDAVAHQWKQPLSIISMAIDSILLKFDFQEKVSKEEIVELSMQTKEQINHLSSTVDEFRQFFRSNKDLLTIDLTKLLNSTIKLMNSDLSKNSININVEAENKVLIECLPNELKHVFINLINNAKDAFIERKKEKREIKFKLIETDKYIKIEAMDNAGGIPEKIITKIFDSNFTTKGSEGGSGIGLYLTKQIIEKLNGTIEVSNINNGAKFTITFYK